MAMPPPIPVVQDRISAGVAAGIITSDQALALRQLPLDSVPERFSSITTGDEPFALFRGFRDVFLSLGIVILALGLGSIAKDMFGLEFDGVVTWQDVGVSALLAAFAWAIAEWVTARLRMPLASLVTCLAFISAFTAMVLTAVISANLINLSEMAMELSAPVVMTLGGLIFYLRFRLPFALLAVAGSLALTIFYAVSDMFGSHSVAEFQIVAGGVGLLIFAGAVFYELRDPKRQTRFSENAFWLHLIAAPLIVFALTGGLEATDISNAGEAVRIFVIVFALGFLALMIDRRAFIVAALLYLAGAVAYTISQSGISPDNQLAFTALVLGLFVVGLALGWQPLRRAFLRLLPDGLSSRLPNPVGPDALGG
ncbi:MAG: hypothetical protein Rhims3KO_10670 [Hyphomicrobiales bacterium]